MKLSLAAILLLVAAVCARPAAGQAPAPVFGNGPIPDKPFASWSLFLPCNPQWLLDKQEAALRDLFAAYRAFAVTSGSRHAAVWFVKSKSSVERAVAEDPKSLDIERSVSYCQRFRLVPSEGPHIVVTTTHPDRWAPPADSSSRPGDPLVVLALGEKTAEEIARLIRRLNDQVVSERLSQQDLASESYWQSWLRVVDGVCRFFDKVKFTVDAKVVNIERTGVCN
jgi:hypothetical protein